MQSKRILVVQYSSRLDGSAFSGLLLANGFRESGWDTHVAFAMEGPIIQRYRDHQHATYIVSHKNWLRRRKSHQFMKDFVLEYRKGSEFRDLIDSINPDIIYINTAVSLAAAVAAKKSNIQVVWHIREMFADIGGEMQAPDWARKHIQTLIGYLSDKIVANSKATAQNFFDDPADKSIEIIPNAINEDFFLENIPHTDTENEISLPEEKCIIGVPATLRPMKGHPFLLNSLAPLLHSNKDVVLAITGDGVDEYVVELKRLVEDLQIAEQVIFLGWISDMKQFYQKCTIICIPSRAEPFGRTVIEAQASRLPVVATAVGGITEIITDGKDGLLVDYGDSEQLRESIKHLIEDKDLRRSLAASAYKSAYKKYHEKIYKKRIVQLTETMMF